jgi:hypothetical protein
MNRPEGIAYAAASGVGAIYGLYATIARLLSTRRSALAALWRRDPILRSRLSYWPLSDKTDARVRLDEIKTGHFRRLARHLFVPSLFSSLPSGQHVLNPDNLLPEW